MWRWGGAQYTVVQSFSAAKSCFEVQDGWGAWNKVIWGWGEPRRDVCGRLIRGSGQDDWPPPQLFTTVNWSYWAIKWKNMLLTFNTEFLHCFWGTWRGEAGRCWMSEHGTEWMNVCVIHELHKCCTCDSVVKTHLYCSICPGKAEKIVFMLI